MDPLWSIEDKLRISTTQAISALICTAVLVLIVCTIITFTILKSKKRCSQIMSHNDIETSSLDEELVELCSLKTKGLARGAGCWSGARKWDGNGIIDEVMMKNKFYSWFSGSKLEVWQRPILMGEKCEFPRFSGLILYDDKGRPINHSPHQHLHSGHVDSCTQVQTEVAITTTLLRDFL